MKLTEQERKLLIQSHYPSLFGNKCTIFNAENNEMLLNSKQNILFRSTIKVYLGASKTNKSFIISGRGNFFSSEKVFTVHETTKSEEIGFIKMSKKRFSRRIKEEFIVNDLYGNNYHLVKEHLDIRHHTPLTYFYRIASEQETIARIEFHEMIFDQTVQLNFCSSSECLLDPRLIIASVILLVNEANRWC